jgi:hypothetical protein
MAGNATLLLSLLTPPPNDDSDDEENHEPVPRFFPSQLTGIDYSEASIKLAQGVAERRRDMWKRRVAKARKMASGSRQDTTQDETETAESEEDSDEDYDSDDETISPESLHLDDPLLTTLPLFLTGDLLNFQHIRDLYSSLPETHPMLASEEINEPWDLVLDKGTFDALALSQDTIPLRRVTSDGTEEVDQRLPSAVYPGKVAQLVRKGGFFLITCGSRLDVIVWSRHRTKGTLSVACNFTEQEIKSRFVKPEFGKWFLQQKRCSS